MYQNTSTGRGVKGKASKQLNHGEFNKKACKEVKAAAAKRELGVLITVEAPLLKLSINKSEDRAKYNVVKRAFLKIKIDLDQKVQEAEILFVYNKKKEQY